MYRMLLPSEVEFREHVVNIILSDPTFVDIATFSGAICPTTSVPFWGAAIAMVCAVR